MWGPQLAALADESTVVAWDEPGAGRSSDVPGDFGLVDYANCLAALIGALDLGPAHVAGLSWGGTVAQELYRHHPELVATLLLVDTYAGWKGSLPEEEVRVRFEGVRQMLRGCTTAGTAKPAADMHDEWQSGERHYLSEGSMAQLKPTCDAGGIARQPGGSAGWPSQPTSRAGPRRLRAEPCRDWARR
jgi:pimeloyl-ACP methyl ester carboxylesterase